MCNGTTIAPIATKPEKKKTKNCLEVTVDKAPRHNTVGVKASHQGKCYRDCYTGQGWPEVAFQFQRARCPEQKHNAEQHPTYSHHLIDSVNSHPRVVVEQTSVQGEN